VAESSGFELAIGQEREGDEASLRRLLRSLRRGSGFKLLFAICNEPSRQEALLRRLDLELPTPAARVAVEQSTGNVLPLVVDSLGRDPDPYPAAVFVTGLASGIRSEDPLHRRLRTLNHQREAWEAAVPVPVVFWIPEYLMRPLALQAPDFVDWRSGMFFFLAPTETRVALPSYQSELGEIWRETAAERRVRMEQLREWLLTTDGAASPLTPNQARWLVELADHHRKLGEWDACLELVRHRILPHLSADADVLRAAAWSQVGDILQARGELDEALRIRREEELPVYERLGDVRSKAMTMDQIADILDDRGELDEALRIRFEESLPVFERLGDVRSKAVTMGQIADILEARGELDEALRIRREEELPTYERLGDVRSRAVTMGKIADILEARGELDEALRIRREESLPVFERLGDVRSKAVTMGQIANILEARGEPDEALRIRREEELSVYERLGDVRSKAVTMSKIADILEVRGELDEALRIRRDESLPILERLGDARSIAAERAKLAQTLIRRGEPQDLVEVSQLLSSSLAFAERSRLAIAEPIRHILKTIGAPDPIRDHP
jgi:tetratricopeptide (TPR) repeat protein